MGTRSLKPKQELSDLVRRRYQSVGLTGWPGEDATSVVRRLGAMQSQDYGPAKWSIGQRTGVDNDTLDRQFDDGQFLRTHVLRPTWHFVHPADLRWLLELTRDRVHMINGFMYRQEGLDRALRDQADAVLIDVLRGGRSLTRSELAAALKDASIVAERFRLAYLLMSAELDGIVCSGPRRGTEHTYSLVEERVPAVSSLTRDEALAELTYRYFSSHGPATAKDFGWWSSLTQTEIKRGLQLAGDRLTQEQIDGVVYWSTDEALSRRAPGPRVDLLQGYDEYIVGYSESKYLLDLAGRTKTARRVAFNGVVLVDGQVTRQWKRTVTKTSVAVEAVLYESLAAKQLAALEVAVDRHGQFLGRPATLKVVVL